MFIGHYSFAFIAKVIEPKIPLTVLTFATQFVDYLWGIFVLTNIEEAKLIKGYTKTSDLHISAPYSHSLLGALGWGILLSGSCRFFTSYTASNKASFLILAAVVSHWFEDLIVHKKDLLLLTFDFTQKKYGYALWDRWFIGQFLEIGLFLVPFYCYVFYTKPDPLQLDQTRFLNLSSHFWNMSDQLSDQNPDQELNSNFNQIPTTPLLGSSFSPLPLQGTSTPVQSPRTRRIVEYADRYIPIRTPDLVSDFQRLSVPTSSQGRKRKIASLIEEEALQEDDRIYKAVLESTMFPGFRESNDDIVRRINMTTGSTPTKGLLTFKSPSKKSRHIDTPFRDAYSMSPLTWSAQNIMTNPRKPPRYISKFPYKVLDAPDLQDDFYLNLVDWSSTNVLGVGLGTCVYLWNAVTSRVIKLCDLGQNQNDNVTSVSWMPIGTHIAVGTNNGPVEIWDIQKNKKIRKMDGHTQRVGALAWNGYTVSTGSRDRVIYHRDVRVPDNYTEVLSGHRQEVCGLKWNPEGTQLASGGNDNRLLIWDRTTGGPLHKWNHHTAAVKAIAWSPHSHGILSSGGGSQDKHIRFWNTVSGEALESHDTESQVCNLAWSKHANELVSTHGYSQNQIILWSYPSMEQLAVLKGHTLRVLYLSVSPDGQNIVTGAGDETLRFWNVFNNGKKEKKRESKFDIRTQIR
ncbi:hypothetical protein G9A89_023492 [Geosiphon pyriformis]|nr:hypothetical protein G9A89_023492 [Geosiphon pyriformis]